MRHTCVAAVVTFLVCGVGAEQPTDLPSYALFVDGEVEKAHVGRWSRAVAALVAAHDEHPDGTTWATYRELTGGPSTRFRFVHDFSRLAELDDWTSHRQILVDVFGPVEGSAVKDDLTVGVDSSRRIVAIVEELSRARRGPAPPKYLWIATVRVADAKMTEYAALAKRVHRAFEAHETSPSWLCYANAIGGDGAEFVYVYPFDEFAEVDSWPSRREVLAGSEDGERLASAIEAITETTTSLWKFEPELSRVDD